MVRCVAFGCSNTLTKGCGISFFKFPKERQRRSAWEHYCERADFVATNFSSLCSEHFSFHMFSFHPRKFGLELSFHKRPILRDNAVPDVPLRLQTTHEAQPPKPRSAFVKRRRAEVLREAFIEYECKSSISTCDVCSGSTDVTSPSNLQSDQAHVGTRSKDQCDSSCQASVRCASKHVQADVGVPQHTRQIQVNPLVCSVGTQCNILNAPPLTCLSEDYDEDMCVEDIDTCNDNHTSMNNEDLCSSFDGTSDSYGDNMCFVKNDPDYLSVDDDDVVYCDDDYDEFSDKNYMLCEDGDITTQKQFLVSEKALCEILSLCRTCGLKCNTFVKFSKGTFICTASVCPHGHVYEWRNQQCHEGMPWSDLLVSGAVCFSGSSFSKALRLFDNMNLQMTCRKTFQYIQSAYLLPSVTSVWRSMQSDMLQARTGKSLSLGGDGRCDSPGYSAKYGSYSLLDLEVNKVLDVQLVQSTEVRGSTHMELEGLKRGIHQINQKGITIGALVTDRNVMIKKYMKEQHGDTRHNFDVWRVSKGVTKKLEACAKKKDGDAIRPWIRSLTNHMYWTAMTSGHDEELKLAKWNSIVNHIANKHEDHSEIFPRCQHGDSDRQRLEKGSRQHKMIAAVVQSPCLLRDIGKLAPLYQTYGLQAFHSVVNHFAPKSNQFFFQSMLARLYIAAMHYNENSDKARAVTKDGHDKWQVASPKAKKGKEAAVKPWKAQPTYDYVQLLLEAAVQRRIQLPSFRAAITESHENHILPPLTASYPVFDEEEFCMNC